MTAPAFRADGRPCSREAFYALACDPARSVVIEACAGAGKTWMLVSRIVRALLAGAQPQGILAITFTRKAAGEMRQRLQEWLRDFAAADAGKRVEALLERGMSHAEAQAAAPALAALQGRVLASGRAVEVHTFHAWFSRLMRSAPVELLESLGLQPGMELVEDVAELRPALMRRFHARVLALPDRLADFDALVTSHGRSRIADWLNAALAKRVEIELADQAGTLDTSVAAPAQLWPVCAGLDSPLERMLADAGLRSILDNAARALGAAKGVKAGRAAAELRASLEQTDPQAAFERAFEALFTQQGAPRKLGEFDDLASAVTELQDLAEMIDQHRAHLDHQRMARLARVLFRCWRDLKRERALADMPDLEHCALALLSDAALSGWVAQRLDAQVRHLLVDEFQDTSPLQWHALTAWLSGYAGAGGGASGQQPPAVFIVGDPKQSIYRFRRAEPKVFEAARDFIVQAFDGVVLECDHTRRNAPAVLQALNTVFAHAGHEQAFAGFRQHSTERTSGPLDAVSSLPEVARPPRAARPERDLTASWRDSLAVPRIEPEEKLRRSEMRHVAAAIAELVDRRGVEPGQIMILARKRSVLALAAEALREIQMPCVAPEQAKVTDMPEACDLIALLDALASSGHDLSLAQALKCPLFGVDDMALLELAQRAARDQSSWWDALMAWAAAPPPLARAQQLLAGWVEAARWLPPHDLLDRIVAEGQALERFVAAAPPARRGLAAHALQALLNQALALDGARYATPYGLVRALRARAPVRKAAADAHAVQLLTVHGAKGLEARAVFVLDADPESQHDSAAGVLVDWPVQSRWPRCAAFIAHGGRCPPSLRELDVIERAAARREDLNALYVAMTRAEELLVFSCTEPHRAAPGPSWWSRLQSAAPVPWRPADGDGAVTASRALQPPMVPVLPELTRPWPAAEPASAIDDSAARNGRAVHRVLEWAGSGKDASTLAPLAAAAVREQGLPAAAASAVLGVAARILQAPELARFFDAAGLLWAGNEVVLADGDQWLRVDRLVRLAAPAGTAAGEWWVLDYKLASSPEQIDAYREQLARYRELVRRLAPGEPVRAGFITGDARLVELVRG